MSGERHGPMWILNDGPPSDRRLSYLRSLAETWIADGTQDPLKRLPNAWWLVDRGEDLIQLLDEVARLRGILDNNGIDWKVES